MTKGGKMKNEFNTLDILLYECPECKQEFYSRAQHDFIYCECKKSALDGGHRESSKKVAIPDKWLPERLIGLAISAKTRLIEVEVTQEQLYEDWNCSIDKFGWIKIKKKENEKE